VTVSGRLRLFVVVAGERSFERFLPLLPVDVYVFDAPSTGPSSVQAGPILCEPLTADRAVGIGVRR